MKCKKFTAVLLAVCLLAALACPTLAAPIATFAIGTVDAAPGQTVTVPLSITQVSGIGAISAYLYYDTAVLECVDAKASGIMLDMDMCDANPTPIGKPNQVAVTGMSLGGVAGSGDILLVTFKVKANAPAGLSTIGFAPDWAPELLTADTSITALEYTLKDGGVNVKAGGGEAPVATTTSLPAAAATATPTSADAPAQTNATTAATEAPVVPTLADGQTVALTEQTAVDVRGEVVTQPNGEAVKYQTVAVMLDEVAADPSGTATLTMSMSAVENLTMMIVDVSFDTEAFEFAGFTTEGFAKEMNMVNAVEAKNGTVTLTASDTEGVSGSGIVATLTFNVKSTAKGGEYRFAMKDETVLIAGEVELPFDTYTGVVTVSGETKAVDPTYVVVGIVVAVAAAIVVVLTVVTKRKKAAAPAETTAQPEAQPETAEKSDLTDISGEE